MNARIDGPWGFPTGVAAQRAFDEQDFQRAVTAYRFWYPTVSMKAVFEGNRKVGGIANEVMPILAADPRHALLTANSDTPYGGAELDLRHGPVVVELPPGPFIGLVNDHHQRWIMDMGLPGPDRGRGGRHLILPPNFRGEPPSGYQLGASESFQVLLALRALPREGNFARALDSIREVQVYPLNPDSREQRLSYVDVSAQEMQSTPLPWEDNLTYWEKLHEVIQTEPMIEEFFPMYGLLAALGMQRGRPFSPDGRLRGILEQAAATGCEQMLVAAFASAREDRTVWRDRKWEWVALVGCHRGFETASEVDLDARDRWFIQAIISSPAMFARTPGAGSLYWLGLRDKRGAYLDGGRSYRLSVPLPVPHDLFWSITLYDAATRCQIRTDLNRAAIRSLIELASEAPGREEIVLHFGPAAPPQGETRWVKTIPGRGWFAYFRIYGPTRPAFDGSWRPGDFEAAE